MTVKFQEHAEAVLRQSKGSRLARLLRGAGEAIDMDRGDVFIAKDAVHQRQEIVRHRSIGGRSLRSRGQGRGQPPAELDDIGSSLAPVIFSGSQEAQGRLPFLTLQ